MGAAPRFDGYGRLIGAELIPLERLGRPRVDVVMTLSGIFRDLLPLQTRLLADAAFLAASADEPLEANFVRKNALDYQAQHGCDFETAALRVFSNADGAYGANVNHLIENSGWGEGDELAETYQRRKCFAYGRKGEPAQQNALLGAMLARVELSYQNLESVEVGVTSLDQYFDTLGGISRAAARAGGGNIPVYIGDQTRGDGLVRTLGEQVALETRTRMLTRNGTRACSSMATRVCARSRSMSATRSAGRRRPGRLLPGSTSRSPRPSCSMPKCASASPASIRRLPPRSRTG